MLLILKLAALFAIITTAIADTAWTQTICSWTLPTLVQVTAATVLEKKKKKEKRRKVVRKRITRSNYKWKELILQERLLSSERQTDQERLRYNCKLTFSFHCSYNGWLVSGRFKFSVNLERKKVSYFLYNKWWWWLGGQSLAERNWWAICSSVELLTIFSYDKLTSE